jgi:hypothetical protein
MAYLQLHGRVIAENPILKVLDAGVAYYRLA